MNHIYRSLWNENTGTFVAVSEIAKRGKKASAGGVVGGGFALKALAVSLMLAFGPASYALPVGGSVAAGSAAVSSGNGSMTVNQTSQNAALNWQSFNIGQGEAVRFVQPNSSAVALNRVLGVDPSSILGSLSANGKVFLVNPNGILFGAGASVNVGGLVASTRNISDSDFMAGNYKFAGSGSGSVVNQGSIHADGGYVALLGANVSNEGVIAARLGTVALAAGNAVTLDVAGDGLLNVSVDQGEVNALVQNGGMIQADGGHVLLTAQAADDLLHTVVNNTGVIQAQTIENHDGIIKLLGDMQSGTVNVGGKLDASAPNGGNGGFIETSAARVKVADDAKITSAAAQGLAGSWLIDPVDFTIAASGGDMTGATLTTSLAGGNVTIQSTSGGAGTAGDVNVNDAVSWSANKLTLNAQNNINVNASLNGSSTASLALEFGQGAVAAGNTSTVNVNAPVNLPSGNTFSTTQGSDGVAVNYTVINSLGAAGSTTGTDLQGMSGGLTGNYALGSNIDATATSAWNSGAGFAPVGNSSTQFAGVFNGLGHTITNLVINRPNSGNSGVGLFGQISAAGKLSDIGLIGGSVTATNSNYVGDLVGLSNGKVNNSYATGAVTGASVVGGLMGINYGTVSNSHATGAATATGDNAGGLSAYNFGTISNSYATGAVAAGNYFSGGLVGTNMATVTNSYATGAVTGNHTAGGLVAFNQFGSNISTSYATGVVTGTNSVGGLVGYNNSTISSSYWNSAISGATGVGGGTTTGATGLTTVQMQTASNFAGFTFTATPAATGNNWVMVDADGTLNNAGGATGSTRPMLASEYSTTINNVHQLQLIAMAPAASYTLGNNIDAAATGTTSNVWGTAGFVPIGNYTESAPADFTKTFNGTFDGKGYTISGLTTNQARLYVGFIGVAGSSAIVRNVGMVGGSMTNTFWGDGALIGYNFGAVSNSYATGNVTGFQAAGGLVGANKGTIDNSYATGTVSVTGSGEQVGGLVGWNFTTISNSHATGNVSSANDVAGGLVGGNGGTISNAYATGNVSGVNRIGGLAGHSDGTVSDSYASGNVTSTGGVVGGLVGNNAGTVSNSYASGAVSGNTSVGGLVGASSGTVTASFWNTTTSGLATSAGGVGMATADMQTQANFTSATAVNGNVNPAWDLANTWIVYDGHTSPLLRSFMTALTVTANSATKTYDGLGTTGGNGVTYSTTPNGNLLGTVSYSSGINVGSATITPGGLYSNQQGYIISYVSGALTVNKADLTIATSNVTKTYDGTLAANGAAIVTNGTLFGTDTLSGGAFAFTDANAGSNKTVTTTGVTVTDGNGGGNYNVTYADNTTSTITKAAVTTTAHAADNTDGSTTAAIESTKARGAVINAVSASFVSPTPPAPVQGTGDQGTAPTQATGASSASIQPGGLAGPGNLSGLNVTLVDPGIKLPSDMNGTDSADKKQ